MPLIFFLAVTKCLRGDAFTSAINLLSFLPIALLFGRVKTRDIALGIEKTHTHTHAKIVTKINNVDVVRNKAQTE